MNSVHLRQQDSDENEYVVLKRNIISQEDLKMNKALATTIDNGFGGAIMNERCLTIAG